MNLLEHVQPESWMMPLFVRARKELSPVQLAACPVLQATSVDELEEWCDVVAPEVMVALNEIVRAGETPPDPTRFQTLGPEAPFAIALGVELAKPVYEQFRLYAELVKIGRAWAATRPTIDEPYLKVLRLSTVTIYEADTPSEIFDGFIAFERGQVATFAIRAAETEGRPLEDWKKEALKNLVISGLREWMRILASVPGPNIPERLVPLSERLDIPALYEKSRAARDAVRNRKAG